MKKVKKETASNNGGKVTVGSAAADPTQSDDDNPFR